MKVHLSQEILAKIWYLCKSINDVEWSGIIFCKTEGHPINLDTFKLEPIDILPMHKGEPSYTEFEVDESIIDAYDNNPVLEDCKMGIIHSHVDMNVFFSGTDTSTLHKYAAMSNFCISIIVNNAGDVTGKVAYLVKNKTKSYLSEYMNEDGNWISSKEEENEVENSVIVEVPLTFSFDLDNLFNDRVDTIIKKAQEEKKVVGFNNTGTVTQDSSYNSYSNPYNYFNNQVPANTEYKYSRYQLLNFICKLLENNTNSLNSGVLVALDKFYKEVLGKGLCTADDMVDWFINSIASNHGGKFFPSTVSQTQEADFIGQALDILVEVSSNDAIAKADKKDVLSDLYEALNSIYYDDDEIIDDDYDFTHVY